MLVVDQCEEALGQVETSDERERFFATLCARAQQEILILTLRADRLGEIAVFSDFARLVERGLYLLGPLTEAELRDVIELPARQAGLLMEPGLVDLLLRDAAGEPGALPLVSHALRQTWLRREGRTLTVAGYSETGGIQGAIARSAESVYQDLPDDQRHELRDLMLRLIEPTVDSDPVRLRVARHLVVEDGAANNLVERLVDARLLTSDEGVIEMAHEALARELAAAEGVARRGRGGPAHPAPPHGVGLDLALDGSGAQRAVPRSPAGGGVGLARCQWS